MLYIIHIPVNQQKLIQEMRSAKKYTFGKCIVPRSGSYEQADRKPLAWSSRQVLTNPII